MTTRLEGFQNAFNRRSLSNFFTIARFEPDTLLVFGLLSALTLALYCWGLWYMALSVVLILIVIFCVESTETIHMARAEYRQIVGAKCLVLQRASRENRGIVRLITPDGNLDPELWSTELSQTPVEEGNIATVTGMKSVILEIAG